MHCTGGMSAPRGSVPGEGLPGPGGCLLLGGGCSWGVPGPGGPGPGGCLVRGWVGGGGGGIQHALRQTPL